MSDEEKKAELDAQAQANDLMAELGVLTDEATNTDAAPDVAAEAAALANAAATTAEAEKKAPEAAPPVAAAPETKKPTPPPPAAATVTAEAKAEAAVEANDPISDSHLAEETLADITPPEPSLEERFQEKAREICFNTLHSILDEQVNGEFRSVVEQKLKALLVTVLEEQSDQLVKTSKTEEKEATPAPKAVKEAPKKKAA